MAQRGTPGGWRSPLETPSNVRITVVPGPRTGRAGSVRGRGLAIHAAVAIPLLVTSIALAAAAGAILPGVQRTGHLVSLEGVGFGGPRPVGSPAAALGSPAAATEASAASVAQIAAAYRYPLGCVGITLSADRGSRLGRRSPCWRYGVYVTAVLRRVNGVWRLMLEATSPRCPAVPLPDIVRAALVSCRHGVAP